ncbi:hypothetical protein [Parapedobacter tibetensis]|uniref:hypothetical protein n=1 Tax=Parapedobacter tibetensis TaxID=2972951 RepID=UPI00214D79B3|nr:hypothetical protein [Parapedobacter tibetensis]
MTNITPSAGNLVYVNKTVDQTTTGHIGDGSSWANAVPELADALLWARLRWGTEGWFMQTSPPTSTAICVSITKDVTR